jgi:hypothetical protein
VALSSRLSICAKLFMGLDSPVPPSVSPRTWRARRSPVRAGVARGLQVQAGHALAPHHEAGGAADLGGLGHGQDGQAVVAGGAVGFFQVGTHGAGGGQLLEQVHRVSAAIDRVGPAGQRPLGDAAYRVNQAGGGGLGEFGGQVGGVHGGILGVMAKASGAQSARLISNGIGLRMLLATGE